MYCVSERGGACAGKRQELTKVRSESSERQDRTLLQHETGGKIHCLLKDAKYPWRYPGGDHTRQINIDNGDFKCKDLGFGRAS